MGSRIALEEEKKKVKKTETPVYFKGCFRSTPNFSIHGFSFVATGPVSSPFQYVYVSSNNVSSCISCEQFHIKKGHSSLSPFQ
jgi:hypothetical protein